MNKKRIIIQNLIFLIVSAIIYFASFLAIFNISNNESTKSLISYSQQVNSELVSKSNAGDVITTFSLIDNFRVSIYEEDQDIPFADTRAFPKEEGGFSVIKSNLGEVYYQYSDTLETDMIYYASFDTDSNLYVRVGFPRSDSQKFSSYMLYFGLSGFFILDIVFILYSFLNFKKSIVPLKLATARIQAIVGKDNRDIKAPGKDDLKVLSDSIDEVGQEFKKQLQETDESRQKLDFIINSLSQGIIVFDANFNIIMINDSAASLLSIDKNKALNDSFINYIDANSEISKNINNVIKNENFTHFEQNISGRTYMFEISSIDYQWAKGKNKHGCLLFMHDITSQKNADEMQREFFANASHELKSPLTSILGYQELIKEGIISSSDELKDANERTLKEAQRMKGIVKYMLENSRNIDIITVSEHNIKKYVLNILDSLAFEIKEKHIKIILHLEDLVTKMNHDDLDKLIRNIITNAIKYNKDNGEIIITINAENKTLSIKDNGIGIDQVEVDRIFDRFYMVSKGRNRKTDSSGIGLSIVRDICNYYNLKIKVESKINEGSNFIITFR